MPQNCDFSPMKILLKEYLREVISQTNDFIEGLDHEHYCLLGEYAQIRQKVMKIESVAASFYLKCYLSPFTDKYEDLAIGIRHLSERKHGALIVVQRTDPLDGLLYAGIPIGATFTYSLLESIFFPGSPLHDGAVFIRGNNIVSAAHVLPLSQANTGEQKLGTRHRAALGLSERSDAMVIVVSEETGNSSFAFNGKLFPFNMRIDLHEQEYPLEPDKLPESALV